MLERTVEFQEVGPLSIPASDEQKQLRKLRKQIEVAEHERAHKLLHHAMQQLEAPLLSRLLLIGLKHYPEAESEKG